MAGSVHATEDNPLVPPDSIAAGLLRADASAQSLRNVTLLREAAGSLVDAAMAIGCSHLVAVNAAAEPLTTAATLLSDGALSCTDAQNSTADKVLIVDAATVSGNLTRSCAATLRANGAAWVGAIIFDRVRPDMDGLDSEPDLDHLTWLRRS
jgi:hypothetical protein